jgi:hypothetical protein
VPARLEIDATRRVEVALEGLIAREQRTQHRDRLTEARPALIEGDAGRRIVTGRRSRADADHQATIRQDVDRGKRLCELRRAADHRQAHRGREGHVVRLRDHRRKRGWAIEPWPGEEQMVVRAQVAVAETRGVFSIGLERGERGPCAEVDQWQMGAEVHRSTITSCTASGG